MASFPLTDNDFIVDRNKLQYYWGKFPFKLIVDTNYIHMMRNLTCERDLKTRISEFKRSSEIRNYYFQLLSMINIKEQYKKHSDLKFVISHGRVEIYSVDIGLLNDIYSKIHDQNHSSFRFVKVNKLLNFDSKTVYLKKSKFNYRIHLSPFSLFSQKEKIELKQICEDNLENIKPSPSLRYLMANIHARWGPYFNYHDIFIDAIKESYITIIALKFPVLIKKISKIEKMPDMNF